MLLSSADDNLSCLPCSAWRADCGMEGLPWLRMSTPDFREIGWLRGASWTPLTRFVFLMLKPFMAASRLPESRKPWPVSCKFFALPRMLLSRRLRLFMADVLSTDE